MSATSARVYSDALSVPMSSTGNHGWYALPGLATPASAACRATSGLTTRSRTRRTTSRGAGRRRRRASSRPWRLRLRRRGGARRGAAAETSGRTRRGRRRGRGQCPGPARERIAYRLAARRGATVAARVEAAQLDRPLVPPRQLDRVSGSVVPGQRQRHVDRHPVALFRKPVEDVCTVGDVFAAEHQCRVVARAEAGMARVVGRTASAHERHDLNPGRSPLPEQLTADPLEDLRVAPSVSGRVCDRRLDLRSAIGSKQRAQRLADGETGCPRQESNLCTRFRKPLLYPLSYGGSWIPL